MPIHIVGENKQSLEEARILGPKVSRVNGSRNNATRDRQILVDGSALHRHGGNIVHLELRVGDRTARDISWRMCDLASCAFLAAAPG